MDITQEIDNLGSLPVHELLARNREQFHEAPNPHIKSWLVRRLTWRLWVVSLLSQPISFLVQHSVQVTG